MNFQRTNIPDVIKITPQLHKDDRGFFLETHSQEKFKAAGIPTTFVQDNQSFSQKNTLRALHYQSAPFAQAKLVRVLFGEILDVAVDLRKSSPTFGQHVALKLNSDTKEMLYIPEGFAHGFFALSDIADIAYKCSNPYNKDAERTILWNDPVLDIKWGISDQEKPILSEKDQKGVSFENAEHFDL